MKSFVLGLLLAVLWCTDAARAQTLEGKSDAEKLGLKGRVKSLEVWRGEYTLKGGASVEGRRVPNRKITFNEDGNKLEEVVYDESGSARARNVYTYDAAGRHTGYEEYVGVSDGGLAKPRRHVHTLDAAGRAVGYVVYESDGTAGSRFTYAYDAAGNKTEEASYSWNGQRTSRLVHTYDARGRLLTQTTYNADDSVGSKLVNTYDAEGRKTEAAQYHGATLRYRFFYRYDAKGRVKEQETREYNAPQPPDLRPSHAPEPGRVVYAYDDERRTKEVAAYDEHGALKSRLAYAADGHGNDAGVSELNADGSFRDREIHWYDRDVLLRTLSGAPSVEFVYDARGNWTRKTFLIKPADAERPEPYRAECREIIYY